MSGSAMKVPGTFASLSSSLLARKGGARPAMRPTISTSLDDLGWNDMGDDQPVAAAPVQDTPVYPEPLKYQETIAEEFAEPTPAVTREIVRLVKSGPRVTRQLEPALGKIAFTLRLDHDRHLRLRLATAVTNRSAQKIVTDALDAYLDAHPELDQLAEQVPPLTSDSRN